MVSAPQHRQDLQRAHDAGANVEDVFQVVPPSLFRKGATEVRQNQGAHCLEQGE
jgi:hypothetical protein